ncbi:MAG: hypothetical protein HQL98_14870, partial [Magnetococcales bacterium]|nr:hypothetical protein [Magnetococcales bacterium]
VATRTVTFSVTDSNSNGEGAGASTTSATRDIVVQSVNDAPTWNGTPLPTPMGREGEQITFAVTPNSLFADVDSPNLTFSVGALPDFLQFDPTTKSFTGLPGTEDVGKHTISIIATDEAGATATVVIELTIEAATPVAAPPVVAPPTVETTPIVTPPTVAVPLTLPESAPVEPVVASTAPADDSASSSIGQGPDWLGMAGQTSGGATAFDFSTPKDSEHLLDGSHFIPDPPQDQAVSKGATAESFGFTEQAQALGKGLTGSDENTLFSQSEWNENFQHEGVETAQPVISGPRRMDLKIGTTLRESDAQVFTPPISDADQKSKRGIMGYGVTEGKSPERGMLGLTSQLNAHGAKRFFSELQELLGTVQEKKD